MTNKRPHILVTNDDGIFSQGISFLWDALKDLAELTVVAPLNEQSGKSLSITVHEPLHLEQIAWPNRTASAWAVNGTPADCVKLGLSVLLSNNPPDLIVSGINRGTNAGRDVLYSGTVGGAIEGVIHNVPAMAISCDSLSRPNYELTTGYIPTLVTYVLKHPLPHGTLLNVNFPEKNLKGIKMTKQGKEHWLEEPNKRSHPHKQSHYYWLGAKRMMFEEEHDCDVSWLARGYATAVPIHIGELTDHEHLALKKFDFEGVFSSCSSQKKEGI